MLTRQSYTLLTYKSDYQLNLLGIWGGINNLMFGEDSPESIFNQLQAYWQNAKNAGFKVVAFTVTPSSVPGIKADFESRRQSLNTLIRQAAGQYHVLVDLANDNRIGQAGNELNPAYFYSDHVHMVDGGFQIVASIVETAITEIL